MTVGDFEVTTPAGAPIGSHCSVAKVLSQKFCRKSSVAKVLSQKFCRKSSVAKRPRRVYSFGSFVAVRVYPKNRWVIKADHKKQHRKPTVKNVATPLPKNALIFRHLTDEED
jgi:hypothetical protein